VQHRRGRGVVWTAGGLGFELVIALVWLGFELVITPALGLSQAKRLRLVDCLALAVDDLLYGLVLPTTRSRGARLAA